MASQHSQIKITTIALANRRRILFTLVTLLCLTNVAEGKIRLAPRGKKNKNKKLRNPQKKANAQILLKPQKKKATTLKLEATIGVNEKGQNMLLLSDESVAAVSTAMQSSNTEVKEEAQKSTQKKAQQEELKMATQEEEPMEQQVLFYDPAEMKTAAGEIPLPKHVFDADGNEVDIAGKEAVLVPPQPDPKDAKDDEVSNLLLLTRRILSTGMTMQDYSNAFLHCRNQHHQQLHQQLHQQHHQQLHHRHLKILLHKMTHSVHHTIK